MKHAVICSGIWFVIGFSVVGCSSSGTVNDKDTGAGAEERCVRLLRELRLYCTDGLRDDKASVGKECLSRRLEVRKLCY